MRILIFGGSGGLGSLTTKLLSKNADFTVSSLSSKDVNVTSSIDIKKIIETFKPEVVLNFTVYNSDGAIHKLDEIEVKKQIDVNIVGALNIMKESLTHMRKEGFGRVIFLSSVLSTNPVFGTSIYSGSKGFIDNLVKTAAIENAKFGVTVNSLQLGYFEAGLIDKVPPQILESIKSKIPFKRLGTAQELVNAINFIINTEYFSGVNLPLSGGLNLSSL